MLCLDITVETVEDGEVNIVGVECVNTDYIVYPGSIIIDGNGHIAGWGDCVAGACYPGTQPGLGSKGVTIEMGSLYVGEANAPAQSGDLVIVTLAGWGDACVAITENAIRAGVVMENPFEVVQVNTSGCTVDLPDLSSPCPTCLCDLNCDGWVTLADLYCFVGLLNRAGPPYQVLVPVPPLPGCNCPACADANGDVWITLPDMYMCFAMLSSWGPPYMRPCQ
jgi:hypothetical protein